MRAASSNVARRTWRDEVGMPVVFMNEVCFRRSPFLTEIDYASNQWTCICRKNSSDKGTPDAAPITESMVHLGHSAVEP